MKIFVTGCCGYIGSHTCVELLNAGYDVVGLDNFSNSKPIILEKIKEITGKRIDFYEGNMSDEKVLKKVFLENDIYCVIDFAAYKAVGESVAQPVKYYINNMSTVLTLLKVMQEYNVKSIVFSSTATVYGQPDVIPLTEKSNIGKTESPYATSKYFVERILEDLYKSDNSFNICILRYFNPIGAHESGIIGEEPNGIPANLLPYIVKVANGKLECLSVFGDDYDTKDGTGVRDYIHVVDLAEGHVKALEKLEKEKSGYFVYNLGTGIGYSVFDIIKAFEKTNNIKINYKITERRLGDIASYYSDPKKAEKELKWKCKKTLEDMMRDSWNYEKKQ